MLSFAPFESEKETDIKVPQIPEPTKDKISKCPMSRLIDLGDDDTECNMLVMFFVLSVAFMVVSDMFRK